MTLVQVLGEAISGAVMDRAISAEARALVAERERDVLRAELEATRQQLAGVQRQLAAPSAAGAPADAPATEASNIRRPWWAPNGLTACEGVPRCRRGRESVRS
jgi:hypothetical protein